MSELRRVLRQGGLLYMTVHGYRFLAHLPVHAQAQYKAGRLVVLHEDQAGTNVCGAYHPVGYVIGALSQGFAVVGFAPGWAASTGFQDAILLRAH